VFQAIGAATGVRARLNDFTIGAVTEGQDALGEVSVVVEVDGATGAGQGVSTDIIDAAARAYVRALSVAVSRAQADEAIGLPETAA
jgi:2-isopropylmalate synthase